MNCSEARSSLSANPAGSEPGVAEHLDGCGACVVYARELQQLDAVLREAMSVPVPEIKLPVGPYAVEVDEDAPASTLGAGVTPPTAQPTTKRARSAAGRSRTHLGRRRALAASVAGVSVLAGLLWVGVPRESLATALVEHLAEEPDAWATTTSLPGATVSRLLSRSGIRLEAGRMDITYAHSCWFRGRHVPHLIVQTPEGPVTVVLLPREPVAETVEFEEEGFHGTLVPAERGSIAVLTRDRADVDAVAATVLATIGYVD